MQDGQGKYRQNIFKKYAFYILQFFCVETDSVWETMIMTSEQSYSQGGDRCTDYHVQGQTISYVIILLPHQDPAGSVVPLKHSMLWLICPVV